MKINHKTPIWRLHAYYKNAGQKMHRIESFHQGWTLVWAIWKELRKHDSARFVTVKRVWV
ncbi:MAG: hypothetical protein IE921_17635 [Rhodobacteraceae bacterium]|nr:hypothetical protein [Paracoccaceae bacterium]